MAEEAATPFACHSTSGALRSSPPFLARVGHGENGGTRADMDIDTAFPNHDRLRSASELKQSFVIIIHI